MAEANRSSGDLPRRFTVDSPRRKKVQLRRTPNEDISLRSASLADSAPAFVNHSLVRPPPRLTLSIHDVRYQGHGVTDGVLTQLALASANCVRLARTVCAAYLRAPLCAASAPTVPVSREILRR